MSQQFNDLANFDDGSWADFIVDQDAGHLDHLFTDEPLSSPTQPPILGSVHTPPPVQQDVEQQLNEQPLSGELQSPIPDSAHTPPSSQQDFEQQFIDQHLSGALQPPVLGSAHTPPSIQQDTGYLEQHFPNEPLSTTSQTNILGSFQNPLSAQQNAGYFGQQFFDDQPVPNVAPSAHILGSVNTPPGTQQSEGYYEHHFSQQLMPNAHQATPILGSTHTPPSKQHGAAHLDQQFSEQTVPTTSLTAPVQRSTYTPPVKQHGARTPGQQSFSHSAPTTSHHPRLRSDHTPPQTQQVRGQLKRLSSATPHQPRLPSSAYTPVPAQKIQHPSFPVADLLASPELTEETKLGILKQLRPGQLSQLFDQYNVPRAQKPVTPDTTPEKHDQLEAQYGDEYDDEEEHQPNDKPTSQEDFSSSFVNNHSSPVQPPMRSQALMGPPPSMGPLPPITALQQQQYQQAIYLPQPEHADTLPDPLAPVPIYAAYTGHFATSAAAKQYRKRTRIDPKSHASDINRVRLHGRAYWVRRIYNAMIDISNIQDGPSSIHYKRFSTLPLVFDPMDLEAIAHHIFDSALAVHTRGWNRPTIYHKKVVRGKLTDLSEKSVEGRLKCICEVLKQKKAVVDDAIRGGVTMALLCDNPEARGFTKLSNNAGNKRRGEKLRLAKNLGISGEGGDGGEEGGEDE